MDIPLVSNLDTHIRLRGFQPVSADSPSGGPNYTAFINLAGQYYILREVIVGNVSTYSFYAQLIAPLAVFDTDWTGRAGLTYSRFDLAFVNFR